MDRSYLFWPFFEEHHRRLAASLQDWAKRHAAHHDENADIDAVCRGFVRQLGRDGFLGLTVPRDGGGLNDVLDVRALALAREILAYHHGLADFSFVMQGLGSGPISLFGTPEQKRRWLPGVADGTKIAALAMSEPDAGSDVANISTVAVPDGQGYRLNGVKTWISNGGIADQYTVIARLGDAQGTASPGAKGLACFVVEAGTPGFRVAERIDVMAPHPLGRLEFRDCVVPAGNLIGKPGEGFKIAMSNLDVFRSTVGAAALGFARRALDEALKRVHERKVFDQKLADYQLTQAKIADMATEIDASALLVYRAAWTKDGGADRVTREASMAKMYATEAAQRVIDAAVQLWGGLGVTRGVMVESLYREIRALRIYEGTTEVNKLVIAGQTYAAFANDGCGAP
jgi:acyl-CoA dehydrogenase